MIRIEYIWVDGTEPDARLRGKTKFSLSKKEMEKDWIFDGSSTSQAEGVDSDLILRPVRIYPDARYEAAFIVLCEVFNVDGSAHDSNYRRPLAKLLMKKEVSDTEPRAGFEQEYFIMREGDNKPLGFPYGNTEPDPQGRYYCGVGGDSAYGRTLVDAHANDCIHAKISLCGINAEVAPGQWEYQIGGVKPSLLKACDDLWVSRYLLLRQTETGYYISFDPKPVEGDWNGSGMHVNFSTAEMREKGGMKQITEACEALSHRVDKHIASYGAGYEKRLTGEHETAKYDEFSYGISDRGASVRIPHNVVKDQAGYFEDRRPGANADPYRVATVLVETVILGE
jgi:glutamine synthetase